MTRKFLEVIMVLLILLALYIAVNYEITTTGCNTDKIIVIDCGHGGVDGGKVSSDGTLEKDINLSIGYKLKALLEADEFTVVMTRTDDNGLYSQNDTNKKSADMKKRCEIITTSGCNLCVSIHQNSYTAASVHGAQIFYYRQSAEGKKLAECLESSIKENLGEQTARPSKYNDNYYMLLHSTCPTVIAECGFLSNPEEAKKLATEDYQQEMAEALYQGIKKYYGR